mmetsp:Transcript_17484/g.57762  ORF Transcript_17484/g.57762 Transcript_17484/m.57762 type:complete len:106 (-) Transcript_17484:25-342(-)
MKNIYLVDIFVGILNDLAGADFLHDASRHSMPNKRKGGSTCNEPAGQGVEAFMPPTKMRRAAQGASDEHGMRRGYRKEERRRCRNESKKGRHPARKGQTAGSGGA